MYNYKIVTDSSANITSLEGMELGIVPLHILVGDKEFVDNEEINLIELQEALSSYKGKSSTSCPSPQEWIEAFGDADAIFCITITSGLSGCCASAVAAKEMYESSNEGKTVYVIDSLSTGPEMVLLIEKLKALIEKGLKHDEIYKAICEYQKKTHLFFSLASVDNFAKNGRISPIIAKGVGLLGIKILGIASEQGNLEIMDKCRGDKKAFKYIVEYLEKKGYNKSKLVIAHNNNESGAKELLSMLQEKFGEMEYVIHPTRGLCSYYAEPASVLVGFETN